MGTALATQDDVTGATAARRPVRRAAALGFLTMGLIMSVIGPALPGIRGTFALSLGEAGALTVVSAGAYFLTVLLGGPAADRWGRRPFLLAGAALMTAGTAAFAAAPALPVALAGLAVFGVGLGLVDGALNALVNEHSGEWRGADLNLTHAFFGFGAVVGPLAGGWLLTLGVGWRWLYAPGVAASLALLWLAGHLRLGRERVVPSNPRRMLALLREPALMLLAVVLGLYVGLELMVGTWAFSHLRLAFGAGDALAGLATALYWGGLTAGRVLVGLAGARLTPHQMIVGNILASVGALALLALAPALPLAVAALALTGLALANIFPAVIAAGGAAYPRAVGAVSGLLIAAAALGGAVFPWLTGVVGERAGLGAALGGGVLLLAIMLAAEVAVIRQSSGGAASWPG